MSNEQIINQDQTIENNNADDLKKLYNTGITFAGIGIVLLVIGRLFHILPGYISYIGIGMLVIGMPIFFFGCYRMARGKG